MQKEQSSLLSVKYRLGYAFMDLLNPPNVQLSFGRYNNRPLDEARVKELATGFREQGIAPWQDPIPISVPRAWIDKSSLNAQVIYRGKKRGVRVRPSAKALGLWSRTVESADFGMSCGVHHAV